MADFEAPYIPRLNLNAGNPANDINSAVQNFNDAFRSFALMRSYSNAKDTLQQIQQSDLGEDEKRRQQNELANQLGQRAVMFGYGQQGRNLAMSQFGAPAQPDAFPYQNETEFLARGPAEQVQQYIDRKQQLKPPKEVDPDVADAKKRKQQEAEDNDKFRILGNLRKASNEAEASSRNTMGVLAQKGNNITDLNALVGDPSGWAAKARFHFQELATGLDRVFKGGVATETGTAGLMPHDLEMKYADLKTLLTSEPSAANNAKFMQLYNDVIQRTGQIVDAQIQGYKKNTLGAIPSIAQKYGADFSELSRNMLGESAKFENGKVVFDGDANEEKVKNAITALSKPGVSDDPKFIGAIQNVEQDPNFWNAIMRDKKALSQYRMLRGRLNSSKE